MQDPHLASTWAEFSRKKSKTLKDHVGSTWSFGALSFGMQDLVAGAICKFDSGLVRPLRAQALALGIERTHPLIMLRISGSKLQTPTATV